MNSQVASVLTHPSMVSGALFVTGRQIGHYIDNGDVHRQRNVFERFFAVTLVDNGLPALVHWMRAAERYEPGLFIVIPTMTVASAILLDLGRYTTAAVLNKLVPENLKIQLGWLLRAIAPRDFHWTLPSSSSSRITSFQ